MNRPVLEFDIQSFQIDLNNGLVIDVCEWPDSSGFITVRRRDGTPLRGSGFKGKDKMLELYSMFEEEFNEK